MSQSMLLAADSFSSFLVAYSLFLVACKVKHPETCDLRLLPSKMHGIKTLVSVGCGKNIEVTQKQLRRDL